MFWKKRKKRRLQEVPSHSFPRLSKRKAVLNLHWTESNTLSYFFPLALSKQKDAQLCVSLSRKGHSRRAHLPSSAKPALKEGIP